jgi:threonine synthase
MLTPRQIAGIERPATENIKRKDQRPFLNTHTAMGDFLKYTVRCSKCGHISDDLRDFKCHLCGHPLNLQLGIDFKKTEIRKKDYSMWRYARFFPYVKEDDKVTSGEGWTPMVKLSDDVFLKLESLNPTGSFKDRGSATLISALHKLIKRAKGRISEDSSGNAGASMAAYAARAGLEAEIYVPETVSGPKFIQIQSYGARVVKVSGSRQRVAEEAQKAETKKFYVGHILHPLFRDGIRSLAYEIAEQFGWDPPGRVYLPVSAGTLILGVIRGFEHLAKSNVIKGVPKIVACQTAQVSPLYHRLKNLPYKPPEKVTSVADALVSVNPPLLDIMVENLRRVKGDAVMVREEEILKAWQELGKKGFYVEPSSAVAYAAYKQHVADGEISRKEKTCIVLTGMGLKSMLKPAC